MATTDDDDGAGDGAISITDTLTISVRPGDSAAAPGELWIDLPDWYFSLVDSVSIQTPYSTCIVRNKPADSPMPFMANWPARHYVSDEVLAEFGLSEQTHERGSSSRHPELDPNLLAIKPFGEPRRYYRIDDTIVDER